MPRKKCKNCEGRGKKCVVGCALRREDGFMPGMFDVCTCGPPTCPECGGTGKRNRHDLGDQDDPNLDRMARTRALQDKVHE